MFGAPMFMGGAYMAGATENGSSPNDFFSTLATGAGNVIGGIGNLANVVGSSVQAASQASAAWSNAVRGNAANNQGQMTPPTTVQQTQTQSMSKETKTMLYVGIGIVALILLTK